jgi:hypothetical protein
MLLEALGDEVLRLVVGQLESAADRVWLAAAHPRLRALVFELYGAGGGSGPVSDGDVTALGLWRRPLALTLSRRGDAGGNWGPGEAGCRYCGRLVAEGEAPLQRCGRCRRVQFCGRG